MEINELKNSLKILYSLISIEKDYDIKRKTVIKFSDKINDLEEIIVNNDFDDFVHFMAEEFEYYEPNPDFQKEHPYYYGDEILLQKINSVLERLEKLINKEK